MKKEKKKKKKKTTHLSTGDVQVDLTTVSTHKGTELLANAFQNAQPVVLSQGVEEVLEDVTLVTTRELLELTNNLLLVRSREGRGADDRGQLAVRLQGLAEDSEGAGGLVEGRRFDGGSVLFIATTALIQFGATFCLSNFFFWFSCFFARSDQRRGEAIPGDTREVHRRFKPRAKTKRQSCIPEQWHRCHQHRTGPREP